MRCTIFASNVARPWHIFPPMDLLPLSARNYRSNDELDQDHLRIT